MAIFGGIIFSQIWGVGVVRIVFMINSQVSTPHQNRRAISEGQDHARTLQMLSDMAQRILLFQRIGRCFAHLPEAKRFAHSCFV